MSFWQAKTKIRREDKLFSDYIRARDGWRCAYRFKCNGESFEDNKGGLTCSHYFKRRHESTRFEVKNCDAACRKCHMWVEDTVEGRKALKDWKIKQLGAQGHMLLELQKESYKKKDPVMDLLYVKSLLLVKK